MAAFSLYVSTSALFYAGMLWKNWRTDRHAVENVRQYFMPEPCGNGLKPGWDCPGSGADRKSCGLWKRKACGIKNKRDEPCVHNKAFLLRRYKQQMDFCVNGATKELAKPLPLTQKSICCTLPGSRNAL